MYVKKEGRQPKMRSKEDDAELDFGAAGDKVWLVKLPKFLYDRWMDAEPGADLGQLKMNEDQKREMRVVLKTPDGSESKSDNGSSTDIPLEYALEMQSQFVANTYIFSEPVAKPWSDRPSRQNSPERLDMEDAAKDQAMEDGEPEKRRAGGPDRSRKNLGGQRFGGKVVHDCIVKPIDNAIYRNLLRDRVTSADGPKRKIQIVDDAALSGNLMAPGSITSNVPAGQAKSFINSKSKQRGREIHARMALDSLLDEIVKCFKQYEYWSLKAFKAHLKQPESYLKETLENIATLHKRGPMTGKWQLKAETRNAIKGYAGLSQFDKSSGVEESPTNHDQDDNQKIKSEHEGQAAPEAEEEESDEDIEMEDRL